MVIENKIVGLAEAIQSAIALDAPLNARLNVIADAVRRLRPPQAAAVDRLVARLRSQHAGAMSPEPGEIMPEFVLPDENGRLVRLSEFLNQGPLAITFQRGHWCPYCRISTIGIAEVQEEMAAIGAQAVAIVPEHGSFARKLKSTARARFPVLSDMDNGYALSLNLAIWVGADLGAVMAEGGIDLPRYQGNSAWFLPIPATFVVGASGKVAARYVDPDWRQRMEIDELLAALRSAR